MLWRARHHLHFVRFIAGAPPTGVIKLNVDAAIHPSVATIAVIAKDDAGCFVKAWTKTLPTVDPTAAEALAILWAIQLAYLERWKNILVESDAKNWVDAILGNSACSWNIYTLCNDVKRLASDFSSCSFCWVKREANMVTYK
jgi:ribonuclease HI